MSSSSVVSSPGRPPLSSGLRRSVGVVMIGATMAFLDSTIVNVALNTLSGDLHTGIDTVQWVVTGYLLALAAVIPATGWAARRVGASRLYLIALAVFTVGSALSALAPDVGILIVARVLQGIGGGALLPVGTMIWTSQTPKAQIARVMSLIGVPMVLAPMFGPTVGGLLIQWLGWRSIFWVNVPLGVICFVLGVFLLPRTPAADAGRLDVVGLVLAMLGTVGITYGLAQAASAGFDVAATTALIVGVLAVTAFVLYAWRTPRPILDVRLYANRVFAASALTMFALGAAMFGAMILMPLYFQIVRGQDVIVTGLLLIPSGVGALIANRISAPLTDRYGAGITAFAGALIGIVSTIPFLFLTATTSYWLLIVAMLVRGLGIGLTIVPVMSAAYRALPPSKIPDATPQLNVIQRIGGAIGTAVLAVILEDQLHQRMSASPAGAFRTTFAYVLVIAVLATIPTIVLAVTERRARRNPGTEPTP